MWYNGVIERFAWGDSMRNKKQTMTGCRVEVKSNETGGYIPYTSVKTPVTPAMATSLASHLKRSRAAGRVIEVPAERVVDEWTF
jgi:hypothetical protein